MKNLPQIASDMGLKPLSILAYNNFGVIYKSVAGDTALAKLTYTNKKEDSIRVLDVVNYELSEYFIKLIVSAHGIMDIELYTAYSNNNTLRNIRLICCYDERINMSTNDIVGNAKVIVCTTESGNSYAINYKGKKLRLSRRVTDNGKVIPSIFYDNITNRYIIGVGELQILGVKNKNKFVRTGVSHLSKKILELDSEFKHIKYFR